MVNAFMMSPAGKISQLQMPHGPASMCGSTDMQVLPRPIPGNYHRSTKLCPRHCTQSVRATASIRATQSHRNCPLFVVSGVCTSAKDEVHQEDATPQTGTHSASHKPTQKFSLPCRACLPPAQQRNGSCHQTCSKALVECAGTCHKHPASAVLLTPLVGLPSSWLLLLPHSS